MFHVLKADTARPRPRSRRARHVEMLFEPFNQVLDLMEFGQRISEAEALDQLSPPNRIGSELVHEGLATWVRQAVSRYHTRLTSDMAEMNARNVVAVRPWVHQILADDPRSRTHELCVWGRAYSYQTPGGVVRELRVPVVGSAGERTRSDAEKSVMAYVVAVGALIDSVRFEEARGLYWGGRPFPLVPGSTSEPTDQVRVLEVGCSTGRAVAPLFQGSVEEATAYFADHGRQAIRELFRSPERTPGYDCLSCKERDVCARLPRGTGMLGIRDRRRPRRIFTVTSGRYQTECAAKEHFRALRLPVDQTRENTPAVRLGKGVHAWLQRLHDRSPRRPCTITDLPEDSGHWQASRWHFDGDEAREGAAMLAAHLEVCPYIGVSPDTLAHTEQVIVADDADCDTLVVAHADLVYQRNGSWCYREVKTTSAEKIIDGERLLSRYPQAALAVLLYRAGAIPLGPLSAIEVEILTPNGADLRVLDPRSPALLDVARQKILPMAVAWHGDADHLPNPGKNCRRCPYPQWCPSAQNASGETNDDR